MKKLVSLITLLTIFFGGQVLANETASLINAETMKWTYMNEELGADSPRFSILYENKTTGTTHVYIEFPTSIYIPKHTHPGREFHYILQGAHIFNQEGKVYNVKENGYLFMPEGLVHEAWIPGGTKAIIMFDNGFAVNWLKGAPTKSDLGQWPAPAHILKQIQ